MSTALPVLLRAVSRTSTRLALSGALALGLLTSAPTTDAHAAVVTTDQQRTVAAQTVQRRAEARRRAQVQSRIDRAVRTASAQKGDPYSYGSAGPNRFDCSGLTYYSFRKAGFNRIPRTSSAQARFARRIPKQNVRRGDLMFFSDGGGVYHVGLYAGRKHGRVMMLHAPYSGTRVRTEPVWTKSWFAGTLRPR
jgi:cell wall-associated NlpC family hydrolase